MYSQILRILHFFNQVLVFIYLFSSIHLNPKLVGPYLVFTGTL